MKKILTLAAILVSLSAASASADAPCTALTRALSVGSTDAATGGEVTLLQAFLGIDPTGYFGPITARGVAAFQAANKLETVGSVGPLTRAAIRAASCAEGEAPAQPAVVTSSASSAMSNTVTFDFPTPGISTASSGDASCSAFTRALSVGSTDAATGGEVSKLQALLRVRVTGTFDAATRSAVIAFQKSRGIDPIGSVGPLTRAALSAGCSSSSGAAANSVEFDFPVAGGSTESSSRSSRDSRSESVEFSFPVAGVASSSANAYESTSVDFDFSNVDQATSGSSDSSPVIGSITPSVVIKEDIGSTDVVIRGGIFAANSSVLLEKETDGAFSADRVAGTVTTDGTRLTFRVPSSLANGTYVVKVTSGGKISSSKTLTVSSIASLAPTITSISPSSGATGTPVTVTGTNFHTDMSLQFGSLTLSAGSLSVTGRDRLTFTVPSSGGSGQGAVTAGSYTVRLLRPAGDSNSKRFTVN